MDVKGLYQSFSYCSKFPMMAMLKRILTVKREGSFFLSTSAHRSSLPAFPSSLPRPSLPTRFALQLPIARSGFFPSNCAQAESRSLGHRYRTEDTPQARLTKMAAVFLKATLLFTTLKVREPLPLYSLYSICSMLISMLILLSRTQAVL